MLRPPRPQHKGGTVGQLAREADLGGEEKCKEQRREVGVHARIKIPGENAHTL